MYTLFVILIVLAALLMIGIVLIQESKGGDLRQTSHHQTRSWVCARPLISLRKQHGDLQ